MPKKRELYRRSTALVAYWKGEDLIVENYLKGSPTPLPPQLAPVLLETAEPVTMSALVKALTPFGYPKVLAKLFVDRGIFVKAGSKLDRREKAIEKQWSGWDSAARHFYYATRKTRFHPWNAEIDAPDFSSRDDPPPPFYERKGDAIPLPPFHFEASDRFFEVLRARRTLRRTAGEEISLDDFSRVLRWTWGATHVVDNAIMRRFILKTSPSGGGRHPTEVYAAVLRVTGLAPGIYHYSVERDALTLIQNGFFEDELERICCQGDFLRGAAAVFFMTSLVQRSIWKYPISHALRVLFLDAGHLGQTFHLVCTNLVLAPFSFAAFSPEGVEAFLGIDGVREIPLYACVAGVPAEYDSARSDRLGPAEVRTGESR
jgi:SagB-type dehydrogenase family enzyme